MSKSGNTQYFDAVSDCFSSTEHGDCTQYFDTEGCAAISIKAANYIAPMNFGQTEVTSSHGDENMMKKPKNARKTKKRKVMKRKQGKSKRKGITKQGKASTHIDEAQQYIGLNVNLEYDGEKCIAFVTSYGAEKKLFQVEFKLEGRPTKYVEKNDILSNIATQKDIDIHKEKVVRNQLFYTSAEKKRKRSSREGSTSTMKIKKNTSSQKKKTSYVAPRKRAINDNRGP